MLCNNTISYPMNLLRAVYGDGIAAQPDTYSPTTALENYIHKNCTELERKFITLKYHRGMSKSDCREPLSMNDYAMEKFEYYLIQKLRSFVPPAPVPIPIEALHLSTRARHAILHAGVKTATELHHMSDLTLANIRNVGPATAREIREKTTRAIIEQNTAFDTAQTVNWTDIGICPICGSHNISNQTECSAICLDCNSTWNVEYRTIRIYDGYDNVLSPNGTPVNVHIDNPPTIDINTLLHKATMCKPCDVNRFCSFNKNGVCLYPLVFDMTPPIHCGKDQIIHAQAEPI